LDLGGTISVLNRNVENKQKRKRPGFLIKTLLITCLGVLPTITSSAAQSETLTTTYHVYVDDEHIGEVDHTDVVEEVINKKVKDSIQEYENMEIIVGQEVSMIPEKAFNTEFNNKEVKQYLEENLTIVATATEMKMGDQVVGYFNGEDEAEEVLRAYKLKYVSKEELEKIEENAEEIEKEELLVGEKRVSAVTFSEEVSIVEKNVVPTEILTIEQGIKLFEQGTLKEKVHKVSDGEVLGEIAGKYDLSTKELLALNTSLTEDSLLQIDQEINVTAYEPFVNIHITEEEIVEEKIEYETDIIESEEMDKGEQEVKQKGKDGKKEVHYRLEKVNGHITEKVSEDEQVLEEPTKEILIKGTKVIPSHGTGSLSWPAHGGYVSSHLGMRWGSMHKGIDIAGPTSRAIYAADHGVIESAGWNDGGYGNKVVMNHNNGMRTVYAHLSSIDVKSGQTVEKGTQIGVMGSTGDSTGIHLHFEIYLNGQLKNPMDYY
jgi:murein DD-endopeptidase MepM/ murein hydrolase activator NlpD